MKTEILNKEHFVEALKMARKIGGETRASFLHCISSLNRIKKNSNAVKLVMQPDFVKHSFAWGLVREDGSCGFHGGMILHGFEETWNVSLEPINYPQWKIHT